MNRLTEIFARNKLLTITRQMKIGFLGLAMVMQATIVEGAEYQLEYGILEFTQNGSDVVFVEPDVLTVSCEQQKNPTLKFGFMVTSDIEFNMEFHMLWYKYDHDTQSLKPEPNINKTFQRKNKKKAVGAGFLEFQKSGDEVHFDIRINGKAYKKLKFKVALCT